jgi:hypothetical protein
MEFASSSGSQCCDFALDPNGLMDSFVPALLVNWIQLDPPPHLLASIFCYLLSSISSCLLVSDLVSKRHIAMDALADLAWKTLAEEIPARVAPIMDIVFPDSAAVKSYFTTYTLECAPVLLEYISSSCSTPLTVAQLKSMPDPPDKSWGVYGVLLEKENDRPHLCVGSATNMKQGFRTRLACYTVDSGTCPDKVRKLLNAGWTVTKNIPLICMPMPAGLNLFLRAFFLLLETTFTYALWSLISTKDYGVPSLQPQNLDQWHYGGCNNHSPLSETFALVDIPIPDDVLQAASANRAQKYQKWLEENPDYEENYSKRYYQEHADQIKEERKEYREANADMIKESKKEYYYNNHDKNLEASKKYRQNNPDKVRESEQNFQKNNPEYYKNYRQANKEKRRARERVSIDCPHCLGKAHYTSRPGFRNHMATKHPAIWEQCGHKLDAALEV